MFYNIHLGTKYLKSRLERFWTTSILCVLNCFKYFLKHISEQNHTRKILNYIKSLYDKMTLFTKTSELYQMSKCSNTFKLYTSEPLLSKNWFYFFFVIVWHQKLHPSFGMPRYWHRFFIYLLLRALRLSSLIDQSESLTIFL